MARHRLTGAVALFVVAAIPLFAGGCACMMGQCANHRERTLEYDGQRCGTLEGSSRNWHQLGFEGAALHELGGEEYYVTCFAYEGRKGTTLSVVVETSAFEPEIYLQREGGKTSVASGRGDRTARISVTLPENGRYGVIVTSRRPRDTGRFDVRYSASAR